MQVSNVALLHAGCPIHHMLGWAIDGIGACLRNADHKGSMVAKHTLCSCTQPRMFTTYSWPFHNSEPHNLEPSTRSVCRHDRELRLLQHSSDIISLVLSRRWLSWSIGGARSSAPMLKDSTWSLAECSKRMALTHLFMMLLHSALENGGQQLISCSRFGSLGMLPGTDTDFSSSSELSSLTLR